MAKTNTPTRDQQIEDAATLLATWIRGLDPTYATNLDAAKETYNWTNRQLIGAMVGFMLENDLYMQVPTNPAFEPGFVAHDINSPCEICGKPFTAAFMGQRYCGNACAVKANGTPWADTDSDSGKAICDYCGGGFTLIHKGQRFCSSACDKASFEGEATRQPHIEPAPPPREESVQMPLDVARWDEV